MVRLTSNSTGCRGLDRCPAGWLRPLAGAVLIGHLRVLSYLRSLSLGAADAAERAADRHREPDAGERVLAVGLGQRVHDADDQPVAVQQGPARTARVDRRVELDEAGARAVVGVRAPV